MVTVMPSATMPTRISGLNDLALNLWWSWNREAESLFREIDPAGWTSSNRNPVRFLKTVSPVYLESAAEDEAYCSRYDRVMAQFTHETDPNAADTWIRMNRPELATRQLGYISAEFGLHPTLPIYSGGLGVLAGDHIKAASDLGLPLVAVSLLYRQGYLSQRVNEDGWQLDVPARLDPDYEPATPVLDGEGDQLIVEVVFEDPASPVKLAVWQVLVGRVTLFLLDADVDGNPEWTRTISSRLYGGDVEHRMRQEIILGIGGVRALAAAGYEIDYWHGNEGHAAFHLLERCRKLISEDGLSLYEVRNQVRKTSVFTTHTPVPAGHDVFPDMLIDRYFWHFWPQMRLTRDEFLALGEHESTGTGFNMTALSFRLSANCNAVSKTHEDVTKSMWHDLWPDLTVDEVPITSVTNGVHMPTWVGRHMADVYFEYLGDEWLNDGDNPEVWAGVDTIPDRKYWMKRRQSKRSMLRYMRERSRARWLRQNRPHVDVLAAGPFMEEGALTLGFARRFATYKRATLIFNDPDRLAAILTNPECPVQLIFAGKAHPKDEGGKKLIQQIIWYAQDPLFAGRICFVEDYDMDVAEYLVSGVDVWLNNPLAPMEASGTSGMKAAANGAPNLSVLDGWWVEGWSPDNSNGWGIASSPETGDLQNDIEADAIYDMLENTIVPLFYDRGPDGVPHGWIAVAKEASKTNAPAFSARRMVKDYVDRLYGPASGV